MIVNYSSDITVADIAARDAITIRTNGMRVFVQDASADANADDSAIYSWNGTSWDLENADVETDQKYLDKVIVDTARTSGWDVIQANIFVDGTKSTNPRWEEIGTSGFYAYKVAINKEAWGSFVIPHSYKPGGNLYLHLNFTTDGTDTRSVKWRFDYSIMKSHNQATGTDLFPATTMYIEQQPPGVAFKHISAMAPTTLVLTNAEPGAVCHIKITRVTNGVSDNTDSVFGMSMNCQFEIDRVGTLNRHPNYYGA